MAMTAPTSFHIHCPTAVLLLALVFLMDSAAPLSIGSHHAFLNKEAPGIARRALQQSTNSIIWKKKCFWDENSRSCRMSLSALADLYNQLPEGLLDLAFSVQDCSPVRNEDGCNKKVRPGCHWTGKGRCEPLLYSGFLFSTKCYGSAQNIFIKNCRTRSNRIRQKKCENIDYSTGCVWEPGSIPSYDQCVFSTTDFTEDLAEIANRKEKDLPSVEFSVESADMVADLGLKCPSADEASCVTQEDCIYSSGDGCIPKPSAVMRLANITRDEESEHQCSLVDLVRIGECSLAMFKENCQEVPESCFWDIILGACLPRPEIVFEAAAAANRQLMRKYSGAKDLCEGLKTIDKCESEG